ncbi:MAG: CheR family methyltransferase [Thermomicrobiales bacterium]
MRSSLLSRRTFRADHRRPAPPSGSPSRLSEVLGSRSNLPVQPITDHHDLVNGTIYIVVPNTHIAISDSDVRVVEDGPRPMPSIDLLFQTASDIYQDNLIAVILSGTGSDGTEGVRAVKEKNGQVIIEDPQTSAFPAMALSIPPTLVDFIVEGDAIGQLLYDLLTGSYSIDTPLEENHLQHLLAEIQAHSGINYSAYKSPTITRRIQRRMVAAGCRNLAQYISYLEDNPDEYESLAQSFLIKVTEFFRDPELFEYLLGGGLQPLIDHARETGELRIWSAGCATGEEAYSIAIVVNELIGNDHPEINVRIFATDIDADAIAFARRGTFSASALKNLPEELVERYFERHGERFEARKALRSLVVFGEHDLSTRSPFPRIDLVVCRNVLIYFATQLQRRVLQLFAFALRDEGLLVLGKAESVSPLPDYFTTLDSRLKIYRRQGDHVLIPPTHVPTTRSKNHIQMSSPESLARASSQESDTTTNEQELTTRGRIALHAEQALRTMSVGSIVISRDYRIQYINPVARRHFGIHGLALDDDLVHVAQHAELSSLRNDIEQAMQGQSSEARTFRVEAPSGVSHDQRYIELTCLPISEGLDGTDVLVQSVDVTDRYVAQQRLEETMNRLNRQIAAHQNLESTNQRLIETNSRLHAANEELLISNEELQAATEEVETLNEEFQATNEELENNERRTPVDDRRANTTNDDLQIHSRQLEELAEEKEAQRQQAKWNALETVLAGMDEAVALVDAFGKIIVTTPPSMTGSVPMAAGRCPMEKTTSASWRTIGPSAEQPTATLSPYVSRLSKMTNAGRWRLLADRFRTGRTVVEA